MDPKQSTVQIEAHALKSISRSTKALAGSVDFPSSFLDELLPRYRPSVEVALGSNHSANVLGVLDHFDFEKLLTVCRDPVQTARDSCRCHIVPNSTSDG